MHHHFYTFSAKTPFDLGRQMGTRFQAEAQAALAKVDKVWPFRKATAALMHPYAVQTFPHYVEELKGYAVGAGLDFTDFWTLSLEDDAFARQNKNHPQCTTMITNQGLLIAHNEDSYEPGHENDVCIIKKTLGEKTTLEIFYYNTIGGTAIGVNSHGFAQTINSLLFQRKQIGVPKTLIARYLLDSQNPEADFEFVKKLKRASGYNHNLIRKDGAMWNIEMTMSGAWQEPVSLPFSHSNHCLVGRRAALSRESYGTQARLQKVQSMLKPSMSEAQIMRIQADDSMGTFLSVINERTVAKMIVNYATMTAKIWLLREQKMGWVEYPLDFMK